MLADRGLMIIAALLNHQLLPVKSGQPEAWPRLPGINQAPWAACAVERGGENTYTCKGLEGGESREALLYRYQTGVQSLL